MVLQVQKIEGKILEIKVSGKLHKADYANLITTLEQRLQQYGKVSLLIELSDFHGWEIGALWEDIKFDSKHFNDIERIAVIGETTWHAWMTTIFRPFTAAEVRYFEPQQADQARTWIEASPFASEQP